MRLSEAAELLKLHRDDWDDGALADLRVFGSVAHGAAGEESDVDLLVEFDRPAGLLDLVRLKLAFEDVLRRRVDVTTEAALYPALRAEVREDAVSVWADRASTPVRPPRRKRWRWRVEDMLAGLDRIARYVEGLDEAAFRADELRRDAVLHNLMRVGETVNYLPEQVRFLHPDVPWAELRQVRHLIAHDYFGVDVGLLWRTVTVELPTVRAALRGVLD